MTRGRTGCSRTDDDAKSSAPIAAPDADHPAAKSALARLKHRDLSRGWRFWTEDPACSCAAAQRRQPFARREYWQSMDVVA